MSPTFERNCTLCNSNSPTNDEIIDGIISYRDDPTWNYYQWGVLFIFTNNTFENNLNSDCIFYSDGTDLDEHQVFCASLSNIFRNNNVNSGIFCLEIVNCV